MSERNLSATVITLIQAQVVRPAVFLHAEFPNHPRRVWTGVGSYVDDETNVWEGIGGMLSLQAISETADTAAQGIQITLDGLDQNIADEITEAAYQGNGGTIRLGFWNPATERVVFLSDPMWRGVLDSDSSEVSGEAVKLILKCEHRMVDILRKREYRYTHRDQLFLHPGSTDTGLSRIESIQDTTIPWGRTQV